MGSCYQKANPPRIIMEQKDNNPDITSDLKKSEGEKERIMKALILGASPCGKSTLYKQLRHLYTEEGLDRTVYQECKFWIRRNCVASMISLLQRSQYLYELDNELHKDCYIDLNDNKEMVSHIQSVVSNQDVDVGDITPQTAAILTESISFLWKQPQIKATFRKRQHYSFIANMDYFFGKIVEIFDMNYEFTMEDWMKCSARTTGVMQTDITINDIRYIIYDAGVTPHERRLLFQWFEGVDIIIFVAALNDFCTVLFEDERINGMQESLRLFAQIVNTKVFRGTDIILFLNKKDLFEKRLQDGCTLSIAFQDEWEGPNYYDHLGNTRDDDPVPQQWKEADVKFKLFVSGYVRSHEECYGMDIPLVVHHLVLAFCYCHLDNCSNAAIEFITEKYLKQNTKYSQKKIFVHVGSALNTEDVKILMRGFQNVCTDRKRRWQQSCMW